MELTLNDLREVVRLLRERDLPAAEVPAPRWPSGGHVPAPDVAPPRCGCWVPLIWDSYVGRWLHLDDLTPCVPGRPRHWPPSLLCRPVSISNPSDPAPGSPPGQLVTADERTQR